MKKAITFLAAVSLAVATSGAADAAQEHAAGAVAPSPAAEANAARPNATSAAKGGTHAVKVTRPAPELEAVADKPNASAIRLAQLRAEGASGEDQEIAPSGGRHAVICSSLGYAPSLGGGGVYGLGTTSCDAAIELVQNRVCIEVYNQNTGVIDQDDSTCKPSTTGYTGCSACSSTSKTSYSTSYCFGHFSYRTATHGYVYHGVAAYPTDRSLFVDMC